ncbi:MAG: HAMP domain-containing sensor histidine kinase [Mucilaginibacter sp.]|jgi:signal transduction histidine kinase|uniref:sensor histidine kinase n=1 Tax=Mucilaginibacter sp. TaxID=1882438 RepID=UPI003569CFD9
MRNRELAAKTAKKKQMPYGVYQVSGRQVYGVLYRFRLLFYTGGAVSVLLVALLGILSYNALSQQPHNGGHVRVIVASGTAVVLGIVGFLVYIVLNELNTRFRAYQQEHELNQLKSSFVTLASHEFRTPLSSILLSASLIEKYAGQLEQEKITKHSLKIKQTVHNLEGILEDFLSLEKLDAGRVSAQYEWFDLPALCRDILADTQIMAKSGQELKYEPIGSATMVKLDQRLIRNALINLLHNAVKYAGDQARICLITSISDGYVSISVKDNGAGIAEKDHEKLFTAFYRVNESGNIPGTGLGLAIVKRYVQLMNGMFRFYSKPGIETCFEMEFPLVD